NTGTPNGLLAFELVTVERIRNDRRGQCETYGDSRASDAKRETAHVDLTVVRRGTLWGPQLSCAAGPSVNPAGMHARTPSIGDDVPLTHRLGRARGAARSSISHVNFATVLLGLVFVP